MMTGSLAEDTREHKQPCIASAKVLRSKTAAQQLDVPGQDVGDGLTK